MKLRIWSHLPKKSLIENFIFHVVLLFRLQPPHLRVCTNKKWRNEPDQRVLIDVYSRFTNNGNFEKERAKSHLIFCFMHQKYLQRSFNYKQILSFTSQSLPLCGLRKNNNSKFFFLKLTEN